jgi:hypothetical protein
VHCGSARQTSKVTALGLASLEIGRDWWSQIEESLRSKALEHFVLVATLAALESADMRRERRVRRCLRSGCPALSMSTSCRAGYGRCSCAAWRVNTASSGVVDVANSSAGRTVYYRAHTRLVLGAWRVDFNTSCPHSLLSWMTPSAYAEVRRSGWLKALRLIDLRSAAQTPHLSDGGGGSTGLTLTSALCHLGEA